MRRTNGRRPPNLRRRVRACRTSPWARRRCASSVTPPWRSVLARAGPTCSRCAPRGRMRRSRGGSEVAEADVAIACALVLAPRATRLPEMPPEPPAPAPEEQSASPEEGQEEQAVGEMADRVLEAARAALSPEMLEGLRQQGGGKSRGKSAANAVTPRHGRRIGSRAGDPRTGARLDLVDTLRAAAPWQRLRGATPGKVAVRRQDFRVQRCKAKNGTTIIFCVDASGSSALHRMAEAKGAVELLLAESYVRRDRAALISFRGTRAEILLPPTRSLARAKRALAALPGGGGTPLAAALVAAGPARVAGGGGARRRLGAAGAAHRRARERGARRDRRAPARGGRCRDGGACPSVHGRSRRCSSTPHRDPAPLRRRSRRRWVGDTSRCPRPMHWA